MSINNARTICRRRRFVRAASAARHSVSVCRLPFVAAGRVQWLLMLLPGAGRAIFVQFERSGCGGGAIFWRLMAMVDKPITGGEEEGGN